MLRQIEPKKRKIIFNNINELTALQLPACDYGYKGSSTIIEEKYLANPLVKLMHTNAKILVRKLNVNTFVYSDTGEEVDEKTLERKKTIGNTSCIPDMNPVIPNSSFLFVPPEPNSRLIVHIRYWCSAQAFVYITDDDNFYYVPRSRYKDIMFDDDTGVHVIKEGNRQYQVTSKSDLEKIRKQRKQNFNSTCNQDNLLDNNNNVHEHRVEFCELNDADIFYYPQEKKIHIHFNPDKIEEIRKEVHFLEKQVLITDAKMPFILNKRANNRNNIDNIVQNMFPNSVIKQLFAKFKKVLFFYDGNPNESIRVCWQSKSKRIFFTATYLNSLIQAANLQDYFEIIPQINNRLIFHFKMPQINPRYTLTDIFNILLSNDERKNNLIAYFNQQRLRAIDDDINYAESETFLNLTPGAIAELQQELHSIDAQDILNSKISSNANPEITNNTNENTDIISQFISDNNNNFNSLTDLPINSTPDYLAGVVPDANVITNGNITDNTNDTINTISQPTIVNDNDNFNSNTSTSTSCLNSTIDYLPEEDPLFSQEVENEISQFLDNYYSDIQFFNGSVYQSQTTPVLFTNKKRNHPDQLEVEPTVNNKMAKRKSSSDS